MKAASASQLLGYEKSLKAAGSFDRCCTADETLTHLVRLRERFGITRIADTTHLQRLTIPTFSAIVPASGDDISIFSGKGTTRSDALASAVMEAVERQTAAAFDPPTTDVHLETLSKLLDLEALGLRDEVPRDRVPCVLGLDLLSGERLPLPLELVVFPWHRERFFKSYSTNGLASGNNLLEAVHHALLEAVERHVWSVVHLRSSIWPRVLREKSAQLDTAQFAFIDPPDLAVAMQVVQPTGVDEVDSLVDCVRGAGLGVRMLAYQEEGLPVCMFAAVRDAVETDGLFGGYGCSWSPKHALMRALTEAVSSRAVHIQGAREDVLPKGADPGDMIAQFRGQQHRAGRWYSDGPADSVNLSDFVDQSEADLASELDRLTAAVSRAGVTRVIVVDMSPKDACGIAVAKVIAPELERTLVDESVSARGKRLVSNVLPWPVTPMQTESPGQTL